MFTGFHKMQCEHLKRHKAGKEETKGERMWKLMV